ncbi:hypothetical protein ACJ73_01986 [Blastomyces percursus]|uniref:DUF7791 domain-containing protein n=1 Tax=Blastomyces percursus TaxID=1658174 RepID=A0A1J9R2K0_9EURO|nr:hypothetical protein ACJ73_01986 [Blastomyces percursus]
MAWLVVLEQAELVGDRRSLPGRLTGPSDRSGSNTCLRFPHHIRGPDKIQELYNRLKQYREQIVAVLLVINHQRHANRSRRKCGRSQARHQLLGLSRGLIDEARKTRLSSNYNPTKQEDVSTVSRLLSEMVSRSLEKRIKDKTLESLYYPSMHDRLEQISDAHKTNIQLDTGRTKERSLQYLEQWASPLNIVFASFLLLEHGNVNAKITAGVATDLTPQNFVAEACLIPKVLPVQAPLYNPPRDDVLLDDFFCFLIDGLDEYDGDHQSLVDVLVAMSRGDDIKILVASRPWLAFQDAFRDCRKLALQDLTHDDIKAFVHDSLYNHPRFSRSLNAHPNWGDLDLLTSSYLDESDPDFALKMEIKPMSKEEDVIRYEEIERRFNSRCKGLKSRDGLLGTNGLPDEICFSRVDFLHRTVRDFLCTPIVAAQLVAADSPKFDIYMTLARAYLARIKGLRRSEPSGVNYTALWSLVTKILNHVRCIGKDISRGAQFSLLDELDRAVSHVAVAIHRTEHWVNVGYPPRLEIEWNEGFITLCVQHNLIPYLEQKLSSGASLQRSGKPFLAFALIHSSIGPPGELERIHYDVPRVNMVEFLLDRGASPNDMDEGETVWVRCVVSIYQLTIYEKEEFSKWAKSWFQVTKLLLLRGADPQAICPVDNQGKNSEINSNELRTGKCTAMDLISVLFEGDSRFDMSDLEAAGKGATVATCPLYEQLVSPNTRNTQLQRHERFATALCSVIHFAYKLGPRRHSI